MRCELLAGGSVSHVSVTPAHGLIEPPSIYRAVHGESVTGGDGGWAYSSESRAGGLRKEVAPHWDRETWVLVSPQHLGSSFPSPVKRGLSYLRALL